MGAAYLAEQLEAMANGSRVSPVMAATAKALDPAQRQAVAQYYACLLYTSGEKVTGVAPGA